MRVRGLTEKAIKVEIARLRGLDLPTLRGLWEKHNGCPSPPTMRRDLLIRSMIWQMQARAFGDIRPATKKYLGQVADAAQLRSPNSPSPPLRLRAGTKLIRVWQGHTYTVTVLDNRFEWQGKSYRSLSHIARCITGTRWNGPVFFGVNRTKCAQPSSPKSERADA